MVRPSITGETIVVQVEDALLVWTDGLLSSTNREYVKIAKWVSENGLNIDLTPDGPSIKANLEDKEHPEQALAALMGVIPGRGRILQAPDSVLALLPYPQVQEDPEETFIQYDDEYLVENTDS